MYEVWRMRTGVSITLKPADRRRLKALARDRNTPHKHVWRAEIVLLSADGVGTNEIMRRTGKSKTCVWRWQERFMEAGYDSLLHDKTRPSRIPSLGSCITERVVTLTQTAPPTEATHWTSAMMAKVVGISASSVQRIWRAHGLQPHRVKQFKLSTDPRFVDNYATHKHPKVRRWLARHPRSTFHFTPTSASWLNAVEGFFAKLTKQRLERGIFPIGRRPAGCNQSLPSSNITPNRNPSHGLPILDKIIQAVRRGHQVFNSIH